MAVAFLSAAENAAAADPQTVAYNPGTTIRGLAVKITQTGSSADLVNGVTVDNGGAPVTVPRIRSDADTVTEVGRSYSYYLGAGIPSGALTITLDRTEGTTVLHVVVEGITADADTEVIDHDGLGANQLDPQVTLQYGGRTALALAAIYHAANTPATLDELATTTVVHTHDFGNESSVTNRQTTPGTSDFTIGWTSSGVSDDLAMSAIAVSEVQVATRFYFAQSVDNPAQVSPAVASGWERTRSGFFRRRALLSKTETATTTYGDDFGAAVTSDTAWTQWVSDPLDVDQTIDGDLSLVVAASENDGGSNAHLAYSLRVVKPDLTDRGVLAQHFATSTEITINPDLDTRIFSGVVVTPVAALAGDRLVMEVGFHGESPTLDGQLNLVIGAPDVADHALVAGEDLNWTPWWELAQVLTFAPDGSTFAFGHPVATLSPTSSGTGVQQFTASGSPVATLSAFADGTANSTGNVTAEGNPVATLSAFADGEATMMPEGGPERARGGRRRPQFVYHDAPEDKEEKKKPRRKRRPAPEAAELPTIELQLPGMAPVTINPETWHRVLKTVRVTEQVRTPKPAAEPARSVEDQLLEHFLETIGPVDMTEGEMPFELSRFLRLGK